MSIEGIVRLVFHTVAVAAVLFALWAAARLWVLRTERSKGAPPPNKGTEALLWVFVFYLICLYQITAFRYGIRLDLWADKTSLLEGVNLTPFVHTIKLYFAYTKWFFIYNLLGNILWFVPLGALLPTLRKRRRGFWLCLLMGALCSLSIELLQYLFVTGISDIDDIIFNSAGTALGYLLYRGAAALIKPSRPKQPLPSKHP